MLLNAGKTCWGSNYSTWIAHLPLYVPGKEENKNIIRIIFHYSDIIFFSVVSARRDVMSSDHCYDCVELENLVWLLCSYNHFNEGAFHKIQIEHKEENQRTYSNRFFNIRLHLKKAFLTIVPLIIKRPKDHELLLQSVYPNEQMFYNVIVPHLDNAIDLLPRCYKRPDSSMYTINSFIVMEDLTASGYKVANKKLDGKHLQYCIVSLARFHKRMLQLRKHKRWPYKTFMDSIKKSQSNGTRMKRLSKIRYSI